MKHIYVRLLLLTFGITLLTSCEHHENDPRLLAAERLMDSNPDSAYQIIQNIQSLLHKDAANNALYLLLKTQSAWKTFHEVKNDTMLSKSIVYYNKVNDHEHLAKSYYYRGIVRKESGHLPSALDDYLHASSEIEKTDNFLYKELINSYIGEILNDHGLEVRSIPYWQKTFSAARAINDSDGMVIAIVNMNRGYLINKEDDKCLRNCNLALKLIRNPMSDSVINGVYHCMAVVYGTKKNYKEALRVGLLAMKNGLGDRTRYCEKIGDCYFELKQNDRAESYYRQAAGSNDICIKMLANRGLAEINKMKHDFLLARHYHDLYDIYLQQFNDNRDNPKLIEVQEKNRLKIVLKQNEQQDKKVFAVILFISFLLITGTGIYIIRLRQQRIRLKNAYQAEIDLIDKQKKLNSKLTTQLEKQNKIHIIIDNSIEATKAKSIIDKIRENPIVIEKWTDEELKAIDTLLECVDDNISDIIDGLEYINERYKLIMKLSLLHFSPKNLSVIFSLDSKTVSNIKFKVQNRLKDLSGDEHINNIIDSLKSTRGRKSNTEKREN